MSQSPAETTSWIQKTPGVCGGEACVRNTRHSVAGLVQWRRLGLSDREVLRHHPDLTPADLEAAFQYYVSHREEVDAVIRADEDA